MSSEGCPKCGTPSVTTWPGRPPTERQRVRHERGVGCVALSWLRGRPGEVVSVQDVTRALREQGWTPQGKTPAGRRVDQALNDADRRVVQRVAPGMFRYVGPTGGNDHRA